MSTFVPKIGCLTAQVFETCAKRSYLGIRVQRLNGVMLTKVSLGPLDG